MNVENRTVFVTVIEYTSKLVLQMATVVSVILQCFTVFVATVAVWNFSAGLWLCGTIYLGTVPGSEEMCCGYKGDRY